MAVHRLLFCVAFHTTLLMAAWILLSRSDAPQWLWIQHCCCALHCEGHKRHFEIWYDRSGRPDWNESVEIWFKSHFKPPLNVVWIWFAKIAFHDFFKPRLNSLQRTLWLQYFPAIHTTQWGCLSQLMSSYWLCVTASQMSKRNENTLHFKLISKQSESTPNCYVNIEMALPALFIIYGTGRILVTLH